MWLRTITNQYTITHIDIGYVLRIIIYLSILTKCSEGKNKLIITVTYEWYGQTLN